MLARNVPFLSTPTNSKGWWFLLTNVLKSKNDSVIVNIFLPSAGSWGLKKIAVRILCIFMCKGTGLLILKYPISFVQIEDKSLILQNTCVKVELWPSKTQKMGRYEARHFGPFFSNFQRHIQPCDIYNYGGAITLRSRKINQHYWNTESAMFII